MASVLTQTIGAVAPFIGPHAVIVGLSQANFGDAIDNAESNFSTSGVSYVPVGFDSTGDRYIALYNLDVSAVEAKAQIADAILKLGLYQRLGSPATPFKLQVYEIEGTLAAGTTWLLRSTGVPWSGGGYGPKPGYDFNATPLGEVTITGDIWASIQEAPGGASTTISASLDLDDAVQRARDEKRPLPLLVKVDFAFTSGDTFLRLDDAVNHATTLHTTLAVNYRPALGIHGAADDETGRPADLDNLHDPELAGTSNRTYYGAVEQGTISDEEKLWVVNHRRSGPRIGVVVGTSRAEATGVAASNVSNTSGSVSGLRLKSVDVYDRDTTTSPQQWTPAGDYVVVPQSTNTYSVEYTDADGVTVTLLEQGTGLDTVSMASDHVFLYDSKLALKVRAIKWRDGADALVTTGLSTDDRFRFSVRADSRTTESIDTLSMARLMPPDTRPFGDTADTTRARPIRNAYTQQMWAAAVDVDIAGVIRTHLKVRDTSATNWATGSDAWVDLFVPGSGAVATARIATVYPSDDATYPDQLRLDVQLSAPDLALMSASAVVTGGIALDTLAKMTLRSLDGAFALGATAILLDQALPAVPAEVEIINDTVGSQRVAVTSGTLTLQLAEPLDLTFPDGSTVFVVYDPATQPTEMYSKPFYSNAKVPAAQLEGLYAGYYYASEVKVV
jgi:hypothetical protein